MFALLKRWLSPAGSDVRWPEMADWASRCGHSFKQTHDRDGFVMEGATTAGRPWRLEWGPPQRAYIAGAELRLRAPVGLPQDLQMLVISRALMDRLERETFERFTESTQTQIDVATPEEMRWLAMFPKARLPELKALKSSYGAMAAHPKWAEQWLSEPLVDILCSYAQRYLLEPRPFVLMSTRGNVYLRVQMAEPDTSSLEAALAVFECACGQARQVAQQLAAAEHWPSTNSSAFASRLPDGSTRF